VATSPRKTLRIKTRSLQEDRDVLGGESALAPLLPATVPSSGGALPSAEELEAATTSPVPDLSHIVRKSNDLVRAHYSLSLNATRVLAYALAVIDADEVRRKEQFPLMRIPLTHIAEVFPALQGNNGIYEVLSTACEDLFNARVEIQLGAKKEKLSLRWAPTCGVVKGHVILRLHYDLAPYLLDLKERYTTQSLMFVVELRSSYHYRLYEIFRSYLFRAGCELSFEELKSMLGIAEAQYQLVGHFVSRVLTPGIKSINTVTDIHVDIEKPIRQGKRIIAWQFKVRRQMQQKLPLSPVNAPLIEAMVTMGIKAKAAMDFASAYESSILKANIDYVRERMSSGYEVRDVTGFLRSALEANYAVDAVEAEEAARQVKLKQTEQQLHREAEQRIANAKRVAVPTARFDLMRQAALQRFEQMTLAQRKELQQAFVDSLVNTPAAGALAARFAAQGFDDPTVSSRFRVFLIETFQIPEPTDREVREHVAKLLADQLPAG
jgi:hypothetical protein